MVTKMVNNAAHRLLVSGQYTTRHTRNDRTKVTNGPIYSLKIAQQLLTQHGLQVINTNANDDLVAFYQPTMEPDEIIDLILTLKPTHYVDSEICKTINGMEVHADGYAIYWRRFTRTESPNGQKTYVKFGFRESNLRTLVLSIHPADH